MPVTMPYPISVILDSKDLIILKPIWPATWPIPSYSSDSDCRPSTLASIPPTPRGLLSLSLIPSAIPSTKASPPERPALFKASVRGSGLRSQVSLIFSPVSGSISNVTCLDPWVTTWSVFGSISTRTPSGLYVNILGQCSGSISDRSLGIIPL